MTKALEYVGQGAWLPGVPARDLAAEEVESLGLDARALVKSGLYKEKRTAKEPAEKAEEKGVKADANDQGLP